MPRIAMRVLMRVLAATECLYHEMCKALAVQMIRALSHRINVDAISLVLFHSYTPTPGTRHSESVSECSSRGNLMPAILLENLRDNFSSVYSLLRHDMYR